MDFLELPRSGSVMTGTEYSARRGRGLGEAGGSCLSWNLHISTYRSESQTMVYKYGRHCTYILYCPFRSMDSHCLFGTRFEYSESVLTV